MASSRFDRLQRSIDIDLAAFSDTSDSEHDSKPNPQSGPEPDCELEREVPKQVQVQEDLSVQDGCPTGQLPTNQMLHRDESDSEGSGEDCHSEMRSANDADSRGFDSSGDVQSKSLNSFTSTFLSRNSIQRGQLTPIGQSFCPILPFSKFPYKYVTKKYSERVADKFFNAGRFFLRSWDLYYAWPLDGGYKPIIFISETQFSELLREIQAQFKDLHLHGEEDYYRQIGLVIDSFPSHPRLRPRFLGTSTNRDMYDRMASNAPESHFRPTGEPMPSGEASAEEQRMFREQIENAMALNKAKNAAAKTKKREEGVILQQNITKQLKRAQRYLGLRPKRDRTSDLPPDGSPTFTEPQVAAAARQPAMTIPPIDPNQEVPYIFENSPIFISVDVEAYERDHNIITEIGVATLDTEDLVGVVPGEGGKNWFKKIRARHFRIEEYKYIVNSAFVTGCADRFQFGQSEFVPLKAAPKVIASCFKQPFSRNLSENESAASRAGSASSAADTGAVEEKTKRNIVFIGHAPNADIVYLRKLGYDPTNLSNLLEIMDTAQLYRIFKRERNPQSVGSILYDFNLVGWHLHNAGNDAVYTLWVLIGTVVRGSVSRGTEETEDELKKRQDKDLADRIHTTVNQVMREREDWSRADEGDDGGEPAKI